MTRETVEENLQWLMIVDKFTNTAIFQSNECKESKEHAKLIQGVK